MTAQHTLAEPAESNQPATDPSATDWAERFADAVAEAPYLETTLWIELVPAVQVAPGVIGAGGVRDIAIGALQIVITETEDSQEAAILRGQGVRVGPDGGADGRSRPVMYDLPAGWTAAVVAAIADRG